MLTATVLLILATSIQIQYRAFNSGRTQVEEAQLARVLLHRIRDDLSALLPPGETGGSGGDPASGGEEDSAQVTGLTDDEDDLFSGTATSTEATLGLYGELDWLRVDVLRPARAKTESSEEGVSFDAALLQSEGEIKRIIYYVLEPGTANFNADADSEEPTGGLVRRELNGPQAAYGVEIGTIEYCDTTISPMASEVSAVEFRYHDGEDWLESWDSSESGLPKAVEIRLFLSRKTETNAALSPTAASATGVTDEEAEVQYRLVVPVRVGGGASAEGASGEGAGGDMSSDSSLFGDEMDMMGGDQ